MGQSTWGVLSGPLSGTQCIMSDSEYHNEDVKVKTTLKGHSGEELSEDESIEAGEVVDTSDRRKEAMNQQDNSSSDESEEEMEDNKKQIGNIPEVKITRNASDSSETEENEEDRKVENNMIENNDSESENEIEVEKVDVNDGCMPSKNYDQSEENVSEDEESESHPKQFINERSPSPEINMQELNIQQASRSSTPDRKDSRGSDGSSSYDERPSSVSPEPIRPVTTPSANNKVSSPTSPSSVTSPTRDDMSPITKRFTEAVVDSDGEEQKEKIVRNRPANDITQLYTAQIVEKQAESSSPRMERAFKGKAQGLDITKIYTAAFKNDSGSPKSNDGINVPRRNSGIAKMYTGGLGKGHENGFKAKPADEFTKPQKHNMSTAMDKEAIRAAYNEVMEDKNGVDWAVFLFDGSKLGVTAKGDNFDSFKSNFGPDDRGFGYVKVMTGDEMSKRSKFVFCPWVGSNVSVMKKAKMSTDKALMKEIIQNLSVELQLESPSEISMDSFKAEVDKAGGARYGTGSQS